MVKPVTPLMKFPSIATLALLLATATSVRAECIRSSSPQERTSPNGQIIARVKPNFRTVGATGEEDRSRSSSSATVEWLRLKGGTPERFATATLLNPVAPMEFLVADDGTLVTLDNWCNAGSGDVLVIYSPTAGVIRKYALGDFWSQEQIRRHFLETGFDVDGGQYWRCVGAPPILTPQNELLVDDALGGRFVFRLDTGAFHQQRGAGACGSAALAAASVGALIPAPLNQIIAEIRPGMGSSDLVRLLSRTYPRVQRLQDNWSGASGMQIYELDKQYTLLVPFVGQNEASRVVNSDLQLVVLDSRNKQRTEIRRSAWDAQ